jgi:hypothetical protein
MFEQFEWVGRDLTRSNVGVVSSSLLLRRWKPNFTERVSR